MAGSKISIAGLAQTAKLAKKIAAQIITLPPLKGAVVVALSGELGAGKQRRETADR